jgi:hypothetical protein
MQKLWGKNGKDMGLFAELESPNKIWLGKRKEQRDEVREHAKVMVQILILCTFGILTVDSCWWRQDIENPVPLLGPMGGKHV